MRKKLWPPSPPGMDQYNAVAMAPDKVQAKIKRGMLKIRQNLLARTGSQTGGGQGKVQVALWPFTCPRRQLYSLSFYA